MGVPPVIPVARLRTEWASRPSFTNHRADRNNMEFNTLPEIDGIRKYRRHLPHWRADGVTYFVTWRLEKSVVILEPDERTVVAKAVEHFNGQRYELIAYTIMDDHVHVLMTTVNEQPLEKTVHSWKSYTGHVLQRLRHSTGNIWQQEYYDRIIPDSDELTRQLQYITTNPAKRWPEISEYSWCRIFET